MESRKFRTHTKWNDKELIPKKSFDKEKDAVNAARYMNTQEHIIHKMVAYKCAECGKWHIGRNNTELTKEDREYYKSLLDREKKYKIGI
jgi:predicted RNA-binding Zn-ribbon protein involved in translation (DUF1610 family)